MVYFTSKANTIFANRHLSEKPFCARGRLSRLLLPECTPNYISEITLGHFKDAVAHPLLAEFKSQLSQCEPGLTWPTQEWMWKSKCPIISALVCRMYVLQCSMINTTSSSTRYWITVYIEQHMPLIVWLENRKIKRGTSYENVKRLNLDPETTRPACEDTLRINECNALDLLMDNKAPPGDIFQTLLRTLLKHPISGDIRKKAMKSFMENTDLRISQVCTAPTAYHLCIKYNSHSRR